MQDTEIELLLSVLPLQIALYPSYFVFIPTSNQHIPTLHNNVNGIIFIFFYQKHILLGMEQQAALGWLPSLLPLVACRAQTIIISIIRDT